MAQQWIVGIDGSPDGCAALNWAVAIAVDRHETVTPLAAWHVPIAMSLMSGRRAIEVDRLGLQAEAEVRVAETIAAVEAPADVVLDPLIVESHPAAALLDASTEYTAASSSAVEPSTPAAGTTVVVGRRGISDLKHRLLGSVSQYLATHASGPVVVVPANWSGRPCRRIVVGFDGSDHSAAALRWALDVAPSGATVVALIAIDVIPWLSPEVVEQRHPEEIEAGKQRILALADAADPEQRAERVVVIHGARHALAEVDADADLIVVGPRGIGGLARAVLGSVTTWLLHDAPCPVAVVPSAERP